jgi:hypothetical protein
VTCAGVTFCAGIVLGLLVPRTLIRRRTQADLEPPAGPTAAAGELEFAAAVAGALLLVLAFLWLAAILLLGGLEALRGGLAHVATWPAAWTRAAILSPVALTLVLVGFCTTTVYVALHGWLQIVGQPRPHFARLWGVILLASTLAALCACGVEHTRGLDFATLLVIFAAAALAALRKSHGLGAGDRAQPPPPAPRFAASSLASVALTALSAGGVIARSAADSVPGGSQIALIAVAVGLSSLAAMLLTRAILRVYSPGVYGPAALVVLTALSWTIPACFAGSPLAARWHMVVASAAAAGCATLVARQISAAVVRVQPVLTAIGVAVAAGVAGGLFAGAVALRSDALPPPTTYAPATVAAQQFLHHAGLRLARIPFAAEAPIDIDLDGAYWDVLILATPAQSTTPAVNPREVRRALARCCRALRPGGRLVIEEPLGCPLTDAELPAALARLPAYRWRLSGPADTYDARVCGPDVPAWLAEQRAPVGYDVQLESLADAAPAVQP